MTDEASLKGHNTTPNL
jgi:hypothetical protein